MRTEKLTSERVQMMSVAAQVVHLMFHRDAAASPHGLHSGDVPLHTRDLNQTEQNAYNSALKFLTKEFNLGARTGSTGDDPDLPEGPDTEKSREPVKPA